MKFERRTGLAVKLLQFLMMDAYGADTYVTWGVRGDKENSLKATIDKFLL